VGNNLLQLRQNRKPDIEAVAAAVDISPKQLHKLEEGKMIFFDRRETKKAYKLSTFIGFWLL
jgi:transcriptional regulator with XRE-family HTH domain